MAYKALIFGTDDLYPTLKPFYEAEVKRGNLEIVATSELTNDVVNLVYVDGRRGGGEDISSFDLAIISSRGYFYSRMRQLEEFGLPRNRIIDGRVFQVPNLDFPRLVKEKIAYGTLENASVKHWGASIYPQSCNVINRNLTVSIGKKSYINGAQISCSFSGKGKISVGNFSPISWGIVFQVSQMFDHNHRNVTSYALRGFDWQPIPSNFYPPQGICKILIGSDVWIGRECILKCNNPNKPLIIGDGAVIASNSVVVKDVPPYAILGGNPAKVIKYRFPPHVIKALLRIKWWDWSLDKIHDNFKYFNDVEKFISLHDPIKDDDASEPENLLGYNIENTFDLDTDNIRDNFR